MTVPSQKRATDGVRSVDEPREEDRTGDDSERSIEGAS